MKKILIAVDDTKASKAVLSTYWNLVRQPEEITLLHVERLEGRSLMINMLGEAEMSTLKDSLRGTDHKDVLDEKGEKVLSFYKKEFEGYGASKITTVLRAGNPSDEILKAAEEEKPDLILLGYSGRKGIHRLISGSVAKEVQQGAQIPVLLAKRPVVCEEEYSWKDAYAAVGVTTAIVAALILLGKILQTGIMH